MTNVLQTGVYTIQNVAHKSFATVLNNNEESRVVSSDLDESDNVKWNVTKLQGTKTHYTVESVPWKNYAYVPAAPTAKEEVRTMVSGFKWEIRRDDIPGQYLIHPPERAYLYWSFENGNKDIKLRLRRREEGGHLWTFTKVSDESPPVPKPANKSPEPDEKSKFVFSIDVGTTHSIVSFMRPNDVAPQLLRRWKYPGAMDFLVKTLLYYKGQEPGYFGAPPANVPFDYTLVKEFKRHIHRLPTNPVSNQERDPLPVGAHLVYQHWLHYLFENLENQVKSTVLQAIWDERILVFPIANGWTESEQTLLRDAIMPAGCVKNITNIHFVNESDAGLHFLLHRHDKQLTEGQEFVVCNAGGGTIDVALYHLVKKKPLKITAKAKSPPLSIEAKLSETYEDYTAASEIVAGDGSDGPATESSAEVDALLEEAKKMVPIISGFTTSNNKPELLFLSGGFCNIGTVVDELRETYDSRYRPTETSAPEMKVIRPGEDISDLDDTSNDDDINEERAREESFKAVASGALFWQLRNTLVARSASYAYGTKYGPKGNEYVEHHWNPIVSHGELLEINAAPKKMPYYKTYDSKYAKLSKVEIDLYAASPTANKHWVRDNNGTVMPGFQVVSSIRANLSALERKLPKIRGPRGLPAYKLEFKVAIDFSSTNLQAVVHWEEKEGDKVVMQSHVAEFQPPKNALKDFVDGAQH